MFFFLPGEMGVFNFFRSAWSITVCGEGVGEQNVQCSMVNVELSGQAANNDSGPFFWCAGLYGHSRSSNHINQKNQTDEMNQRDQIH